MGSAPIGYINKTGDDGRKYIATQENEAAILRWVFQEIAMVRLTTEQIWKQVKKKGLTRCSKNNFWVAIRNPLYCGKIQIPKYKDEEAQLVTGKHEPLISEALFYEVQNVLDGRKKWQRTKIMINKTYRFGAICCALNAAGH